MGEQRLTAERDDLHTGAAPRHRLDSMNANDFVRNLVTKVQTAVRCKRMSTSHSQVSLG